MIPLPQLFVLHLQAKHCITSQTRVGVGVGVLHKKLCTYAKGNSRTANTCTLNSFFTENPQSLIYTFM